MNLNEKRSETGNKNMKIISLEKSKIYFFPWTLLKFLDWVKQIRATTEKEMNPAFYEKFTFLWKISSF